MITRRFLLAAAAVTTAAATIPAAPALAAEIAPAAAPRLPAWVVGMPNCFNWQMVRAADIDTALREIAFDNTGCQCNGCEDANCDFCCELRNLKAQRVPHMDDIENPTPADWLRADCGHCCCRCGEETFPQEGAHPVGDEAVCEECMTPADWRIADPEHYAEMLADEIEEAATS